MYVCLCNGVTDRHIREAVEKGCGSVGELTMRTGCGASCGSCLDMAADMIAQMQAELPLPVLACAA
ncbi:(2Fe-2S)-binding protein [Pseudoxanthomonas suwonensis]|uniref:Bacterioferritin-associated ferredoxin n=1 Tax=Pseudoxanthomonas suwonensis TaxID=314722 RepID=A0A0E3Z0Z6_9GAMM|nr:(2Fe-2S)-binding protein [Pseudoxanthomonas suwonensis]AKC86302.1 bacterioferritin [Pseudoxanthomonas suwonensis]